MDNDIQNIFSCITSEKHYVPNTISVLANDRTVLNVTAGQNANWTYANFFILDKNSPINNFSINEGQFVVAYRQGNWVVLDYNNQIVAKGLEEIKFFVNKVSNAEALRLKYLERENDNKNKLLDKSLQVIYYGAPGTGKSHTVDGQTNDKNSIRTTFHPDSDYSTFVGAYKPTKDKKPMYGLNQKETIQMTIKDKETGKDSDLFEDIITYRFVPQAFLKAYCKAWRNIDQPFYLVIEEINRGNCAQIFGDLFQLLDRNAGGYSSYAIDADDDIRRYIAEDADEEYSLKDISIEDITKADGSLIASGNDIKNGRKLVLPKNLRIWATMNTSDQSLFPIDSAFKRRWDWIYTPISEGMDYTGEKLKWQIDFSSDSEKDRYVDWWMFVRSINELIESTTGSEDKKLGYFFCKADDRGIILSDTFLSKVVFYLWNDVFRDYGFNSEVFKLLSDKAIKFHQFYNADGSPKKDLLFKFAEKVIANYDPIKEEKLSNETAN